jgi:chitinase
MLSHVLLLALASAVLCQDMYTFSTNITESGDEVTVTVNVTEAVDAFNAGLTLSGASFNGNVSTAATRLVRHDGCSSVQRNQIYAGWQDSWQLMGATAKDINYNEGAAIDFLGPPGLNKPVQGRMSCKPLVFC